MQQQNTRPEIMGARVRSVTERCPACDAKPGKPCWELVRLRLIGEQRPIRNRSAFHHIDLYDR